MYDEMRISFSHIWVLYNLKIPFTNVSVIYSVNVLKYIAGSHLVEARYVLTNISLSSVYSSDQNPAYKGGQRRPFPTLVSDLNPHNLSILSTWSSSMSSMNAFQ